MFHLPRQIADLAVFLDEIGVAITEKPNDHGQNAANQPQNQRSISHPNLHS